MARTLFLCLLAWCVTSSCRTTKRDGGSLAEVPAGGDTSVGKVLCNNPNADVGGIKQLEIQFLKSEDKSWTIDSTGQSVRANSKQTGVWPGFRFLGAVASIVKSKSNHDDFTYSVQVANGKLVYEAGASVPIIRVMISQDLGNVDLIAGDADKTSYHAASCAIPNELKAQFELHIANAHHH